MVGNIMLMRRKSLTCAWVKIASLLMRRKSLTLRMGDIAFKYIGYKYIHIIELAG